MRNARLDEAHAGIKIAGRNINNWTYLNIIKAIYDKPTALPSMVKNWKHFP